MMERLKYISPSVLRSVQLRAETPLLAASVVDNIEHIDTAGQQVQDMNFGDYSSFNHEWGTN